VIDLAVGIIIGGAFTAVVNALANNILTPFIGLVGTIAARHNVSYTFFALHHNDVAFAKLFSALEAFLIMAAVIFFFIVKPINKLNEIANRSKVPTEPAKKKCQECLS